MNEPQQPNNIYKSTNRPFTNEAPVNTVNNLNLKTVNHKNQLYIGAVVVILILIGYFMGTGKKSTAPTTDTNLIATTTSDTQSQANTEPPKTVAPIVVAPAPKSAATIDYIDYYGSHSFSPATVVIQKGQSVLFVNKSSAKMWIAIDKNKSGAYPGFDEGFAR